METLTNRHEHFTNTSEWPTGVKSLSETASAIGIPEDRLKELADAHYVPHWRIDGGEPLFKPKEVKDWAAENLVTRLGGKPLPINLRVMIDPPPAEGAPACIREIEDLRTVPIGEYPPGVYFLVYFGEVVYVGQSINPIARISQHKDKKFNSAFMIPVPSSDLDAVEGALIRLLQPKLNGGEGRKILAPGNPDHDSSVLRHFGIFI